MRICKIAFVLFLSACSSIVVWGQHFQKEYNYPLGLDPFDVAETVDQFVVKSTATGPDRFIDLSIDKSGNAANFQVHPFPTNLPSSGFTRGGNDAILTFGRSYGDSTLRYYTAAGTLAWTQSVHFTGAVSALSTSGVLLKGIAVADGFLLVGGLDETYSGSINKNYLLGIKTDLLGNVVWQTKKEITGALSTIFDAQQFGTKTYITWQSAVTPSQPFVTSVADNGEWATTAENTQGFDGISDIAPHPLGGIVAVGYYAYPNTPGAYFGKATCYDADWQVRWQKTGWPELDFISGRPNGISCFPAEILADGDGWMVAGNIVPRNSAPGTLHKFLAKLDSFGNITQFKVYPTLSSGVNTLHKTSDGGFLLTYDFLLNGGNVGIIKTDSNLVAAPNLIAGKVFFDKDLSCAMDTGEAGLKGWLLQLTSNTDTIYTITNSLGAYTFPTDTGSWTVRIQPFSPYWEPCANDIQVYFPGEGLVDTTDFPMQAAVDCPQMEVDISMPFTRRCFDNTLYVNYCNNGTQAAPATQIQVVLDPALAFVSAEIPVAGISGDTLFFNLDTVDIGECRQFTVIVNADCDSTILGQTVCVSAYILPDTFCIPLPFWSGAQVVVGGFCEQDSIVFWLRNTGSATTQVLEYVIIEDMVVWRTGNFGPLQPNGSDTIRIFASGATYGLLAEQEPGYPFNAYLPFSNGPSAWVEACNWNGAPLYPGGFITKFPNEDGNPTISTDCSELVGSYDPNEKYANPEGLDSAHYILPGTPIEYLIRFQNTGTDTTFKVVIRDDLSPMLDPLSFHLQGSSHPCTVDFEADDILKFTFDQILLPDSATNWAGSQGFVKFSVRPEIDLLIGTVIENTAAIFFDFNTPVYTNTYHHTIDTGFMKKPTTPVLTTGDDPVLKSQVLPNPVGAGEALRIEGREDFSGGLHIYDVTGRLIAQLQIQQGKIRLPKNLSPGLYFLKTGDGWVTRVTVL